MRDIDILMRGIDIESLIRGIERMIYEVASENGFLEDYKLHTLNREQLKAILREANSRISLGIPPFNRFKVATMVITEDLEPILYLYEEIYEDNPKYLYGYGFAYNIYAPLFSEFGDLFTPRVYHKGGY